VTHVGGAHAEEAERNADASAQSSHRRRARAYLWPLLLAGATGLLLPFRDRLDKAHVALALLLVVLAAAADGGRRIGLVAATTAFLAFNWFFLPPYGTFVIADPLDWFVLLAFLGTSVVASHLFHRVQREADAARLRAREVAALASLGADAMTAPRAAGALAVVALTVEQWLGIERCVVHVVVDPPAGARPGPPGGLAARADVPVPQAGSPATRAFGGRPAPPELPHHEPVLLALSGGTRVAMLDAGIVRVLPRGTSLPSGLGGSVAHRLLVPLTSGADTIGVLDLQDARGMTVDDARARLLDALAYYAALGAERWRLEQAAERLEALREADQMRNAVLASVSHDLRTPLTTIKALANGLAALGDERAEVIEQEADRLNRFVGDMLDVSRLTGGRVPMRSDVVPVEELLTATLQQVEGSIGARRLQVHFPADDPLPLARFDLTHAVRILVNLLDNARKYAPEGTPIDLVVRRCGRELHIDVADRGPGVAPGEEEQIFAPLYRPGGARPDAQGAGLGLAIARGLAEAQGGSLRYAPRAGGGSVFTLSLPAADLDEIATAPPAPAG